MRGVVIGVGVVATLITLVGGYLMAHRVPPLFIGPGNDEPLDSETRPIVRLRRSRIEEPSPDRDGALFELGGPA